jgi:hypothetical protein
MLVQQYQEKYHGFINIDVPPLAYLVLENDLNDLDDSADELIADFHYRFPNAPQKDIPMTISENDPQILEIRSYGNYSMILMKN